MNVLLLSLMYPNDLREALTHDVKDKFQNQIHSYQRAFVEGIEQNLAAGERLDIINSLPVGVFPTQYRKLVIPAGWHDDGRLYELGCVDVPLLKQKGRARRAARALERWYSQSEDNRTVLMYTLYLPYLQAVAAVKRHHPDLKAATIVTDLPNGLGLASGRKGLMKRIEYLRGDRATALCETLDGFVLLTAPMAEPLSVGTRPSVVIEGLIQSADALPDAQPTERPVVLYTGTLEPELGIADMVNAFRELPEADLWVCGFGSMEAFVREAAEQCANIRFFGFVPHERALELQASASVLMNPRPRDGVFTRYSFPSKTLEYMRAGKPVLCYKLEGIPADYDPYLTYIKGDGAQGITQAVRALLALPRDELKARGERARAYVLQHKNPRLQCQRLVAMLRGLKSI